MGKYFIMSFVGDMLVDAGFIYPTDIYRFTGSYLSEFEVEELDLLGKEYKYRVKTGLYYRIVISKAGLVFVERYEHNQLTASDFTGLAVVPSMKCGLTIQNHEDNYNIDIFLWQTYLDNEMYGVVYNTCDLETYNTMEAYTIDSTVDLSCESYDAKRVKSVVGDDKFIHTYKNASNDLQVAHLYKDYIYDSKPCVSNREVLNSDEDEPLSVNDYMLHNEGLREHSDDFYVYTFKHRFWNRHTGVASDAYGIAIYYNSLMFVKIGSDLFWKKHIETLENKVCAFDRSKGFIPLGKANKGIADLYYEGISVDSFLSLVPYFSSICVDSYNLVRTLGIIKSLINEGTGSTMESDTKLLETIDFPILSGQTPSEEVLEEMRQLDEKEIDENGIVVVPISEDYFEIVPNAVYRVVDMQTLEMHDYNGIQIQGISGKLLANVKGNTIYPVSFCNREWTFTLSTVDNSYVRLIVNNEGFLFMERYEGGKIVQSGYTGIVLNKKTSYMGVDGNYIIYGETYFFQSLYLPACMLYSSTFRNCCEYDFNSQPDIYAVPYSDTKVRNRYRRMLVINQNVSLCLKKVYTGVDFSLPPVVNSFKIRATLDNQFLVSYESVDANTHKEIMDVSNEYDAINMGRELRGLRILAEDTAYFVTASRNFNIYIIYHQGMVFISRSMFVWDKIYHGGNKVNCWKVITSKQKCTLHLLRPTDNSIEMHHKYLDGVTLDDFIEMSKYFNQISEMIYFSGKSLRFFKDLLFNVTGMNFEEKDGARSMLDSINFPLLDGQEIKDTFITDRYYYYKGNCIKLKNYSYYNMRHAYREEGKVPQFKTVLSCLERWFD